MNSLFTSEIQFASIGAHCRGKKKHLLLLISTRERCTHSEVNGVELTRLIGSIINNDGPVLRCRVKDAAKKIPRALSHNIYREESESMYSYSYSHTRDARCPLLSQNAASFCVRQVQSESGAAGLLFGRCEAMTLPAAEANQQG